MKGMNVSSSSCTSQASTAIIHTNSSPSSASMELKLPSSSFISPSSSSFISPSSSSSRPVTAPRLLDGCGGGGGGGGRAIDRHNPIVTDGKRSMHISSSIANTPIASPYPPSMKNTPLCSSTPLTPTNPASPVQTNNKPNKKTKKKKKDCTAKKTLTSLTNKDDEPSHHHHHQYEEVHQSTTLKKGVPTTEYVTTVKGGWATKSEVKPWLEDYISQPAESARYLLAGNDTDFDHDDHRDVGAVDFFDELLRFDRLDNPSDEEEEAAIKLEADNNDQLVPMTAKNTSPDHHAITTTKLAAAADDQSYDITPTHSKSLVSNKLSPASTKPRYHQLPSSSTQSTSSSSSSHGSASSYSSSDHQVVVLRVSLHCRGCEGKVRKHISRMKGVRSFKIDFAAKIVTVVGDVTPLGVLASISKVKTAQLWTPPPSSALV